MPVERASIDNFREPTCHACKETGSHYLPPAAQLRPGRGQSALLPPPGCVFDPALCHGLLGSRPFSAPASSPALTNPVCSAVLPQMLCVFVLERILDWYSSGELPGAENPWCFRPCRRPGGA